MYHFCVFLTYVRTWARTSAKKKRFNLLFFTDLRQLPFENGLRYYCTAFTIAIKRVRYQESGQRSVYILD